MYSVIIPVYGNAEFVPSMIAEFASINEIVQRRFRIPVEFVFVVDKSPDASYTLLEEALPGAAFCSQLILHARNFGSFAAIRTGLHAAKGDYFGIIAADLQEPPEILVSFLQALIANTHDIAVGVREGRSDPVSSRFSANLFWSFYRRFVMKEIPPGGVDVFGCNRKVRDQLLKLDEANSSLLGQVFWLGFRRIEVGYVRRTRAYGKSAWTLRKKIAYLLDSVFAFTALPIHILTVIGALGTSIAMLFGIIIIILRLANQFEAPGYAATMVAIMFFGALNTLGLGIVGAYTWRAYENTKHRPLAVVQSAKAFEGTTSKPVPNPLTVGNSS